MCKVFILLAYLLGVSLAIKTSLPKLNPVLTDQTKYLDSKLQIFCSVEHGDEPFFFDWFKDGQAIKSSPEFTWNIENFKSYSTLSIDRIDRSDAGNYTCLVKNHFGSDSISVLLKVKGS